MCARCKCCNSLVCVRDSAVLSIGGTFVMKVLSQQNLHMHNAQVRHLAIRESYVAKPNTPFFLK